MGLLYHRFFRVSSSQPREKAQNLLGRGEDWVLSAGSVFPECKNGGDCVVLLECDGCGGGTGKYLSVMICRKNLNKLHISVDTIVISMGMMGFQQAWFRTFMLCQTLLVVSFLLI